ncbi:MAG: prolipoprotein diacylglyceryl transferase [Bryobacteraceae bacterium]
MLPKVFTVGDFFLPTYGLLVALAFLAGLWVTTRLARQKGLNPDAITNLAVYCALAGILGAKLMMFVFDAGHYWRNPGDIFSLNTLQAGGVFHGGLVLALLTAVWYMRRARLPGALTADVFAPGIALGHGIGRLGCFAAGCCWGTECRLPWAVTFTNPDAYYLVGVPLHIPLHPTQLYEAGAEFLIFGVLLWRFYKPHRPGMLIGLYLVLYSIVRFLVEFVRAHEQVNPLGGPFSNTQWIALGLLLTGLWLILRRTSAAPVTEARTSQV